eukprot:c23474_g2_i1 orf=1320-3074(+)
MRRHGWQLPYHPLQIVAVAVFFALVFAFYVFFVPFVGSKVLEVAVLVLYSPTVVVVFVLYVWCVAVDPSDNGLLHFRRCNSPSCSKSRAASSIVSSKADGKDLEIYMGHTVDRDPTEQELSKSCWACTLLAAIRSCFCKSDAKLPPNEADMLYCSLCKVEISMDSKHCRVCDKCIDGFDHHCRWLNNCVGRKNYKDFVALMVSGIAMLILQWSVGLWVLVHCFLRFAYFRSVITSKLGSSFSSVAYITVVAVCTLLAMAATYPLVQLFFFHVLLIKKGISTYDYIVAMREQDQKGVGDPVQSSPTSPTSSIGTAHSAGSSAGALQGRAWCTPPRFFLDHEQGVYPAAERSLSVKDVSSELPSRLEYDRKKPVKLNPWALASLNKDDVLRAATTAKKQSSILRPVKAANENAVVRDSSGSISSPGEMSTDFTPPLATSSASRKGTEVRASQFAPASFMDRGKFSAAPFDGSGSDSGDIIQLSRRARKALNPLQMEAMNAFKSSHAFSTNVTTVSSPGSSRASSEPQVSPPNLVDVFNIQHASVVPTDWRYNIQEGSESMGESDGDVSSPCTPIRQVVYGARKGGQ